MAITFGGGNAPSQETRNFDALFTASLSNYRKTLVDNISTSNPLFFKIRKSGVYESVDGGTDIKIPLMHALGTADTYNGYDTLNTDPMEGLTQSIWEWRQVSVPVTVSNREIRQNAQRILNLVETKIKQAELGIEEFFAQMLMRGGKAGAGTGSVEAEYTSAVNSSKGITPLGLMVKKDPTTTQVGNINPATDSWWQNQQKSSSATTSTAFLQELENLHNSCAKGAGGPPDLWVCDQATFENIKFAIYHRLRHDPQSDANFPFINVVYQGVHIVWDEFMPDIQNLTTAITKGTVYMLNSKFWVVKYDSQTNFKNTPFQQPVNQDAKVSHILWMGNACVNNRRKHGVLYNIDATFTIGDA